MQPQSKLTFEEISDTELNEILVNAQDNYTKEEMQAALAEKSRRMDGHQAVIPSNQYQQAEWYYSKKGKRVGPFTSAQLFNLMNNETIDYFTKVWKAGMVDWKEFSQTSLAAEREHRVMPPPLPGNDLSNVLVWILAYTPLISQVVNSLISSVTGFAIGDLWLVTIGLNSILCLYDNHKLKSGGYDVERQWVWALLLVPGYLFRRAKLTKQRPWYAIIWCVTFAVMLMAPSWANNLFNLSDNGMVATVRDGKLEAYSDQTVGQAVSGYFINPKWQAIEASDGKKYVNITGDVIYQGKKISAKLQFIMNSDNAFQIYALELNGEPKNGFVIYGLLRSMYENSPPPL